MFMPNPCHKKNTGDVLARAKKNRGDVRAAAMSEPEDR